MSSRFRFVRAVALVAALALGASACGGDSKDLATKDPKAAMERASERTATAKTVKFKLSAKSSTDVTIVDGTGAYDFPNELGSFQLATATGNGGQFLLTKTALYIEVPPDRNKGLKWVQITNEAMDKAKVENNQQIIALDGLRKQIDPRETLEQLGSDLPNLERIGSEKVRGAKTTRLRGQIDLSDAAIAKAPKDKREGLKAAQTSLGKEGYPIDVWFDADGRVRRVQYKLTQGEKPNQTSTTVNLEFFDFGKPTGIDVPADNLTTDGHDLLTTTTTTAP